MEKSEENLEKVTKFLTPYLPFANAHLADFIIEKQWDSFVSVGLGQEILSTTSVYREQLFQKLSEKNTKKSALKEKVGNPMKLDSIYSGIGQNAKLCGKNENIGQEVQTSYSTGASTGSSDKLHGSLENFIISALQHSLGYLGVLEDINHIVESETSNAGEAGDHFIPFGMSDKKSHEVQVMARTCSQLALRHGISKFVDIGSGKGYLSETLSMEYSLCGIGIDSSDINTNGAQDRNRKLEKYWSGMKRNATHQKAGIKLTRREKKELRMAKWKENNRGQQQDVDLGTSGPPDRMGGDTSHDSSGHRGQHGGSYVPMTMFVTESTDLERLISSSLSDNSIHDSSGCLEMSPANCAIDHSGEKEVASLNTTESIEAESEQTFKQEKNVTDRCDIDSCVMLTGLHTCGNLSPTILKLFAQSDSARLLCVVGCCYHLIDEEFFTCPYGNQKEGTKDSGFPMSEYLRKCTFSLGRNARMLASQSLERLTESTKESIEASDQSKFWRALLQVILQDLSNGKVSKEWQVGRIAAKCSSFTQYVRKALAKLGFDQEKISDQMIKEYENQHSSERSKLEAFCFLRTLLAPVIESLIVLDRLSFLLTRPNIKTVHLVQLFDRAISPRCYAIIATKA
ncbi:methyltransferase-like protein 25 [Lingula anatina]|uniref:Methyltransferase-like protein 25 n=1 Tax=Lingula anatina TaxID=7574 RepID=A0A1S3H845_LINAN|nr:methyltransferase-like protein 25 [Lingula anatina]|eukprot:XP_013382152.1 methyltransferase-like protein 25 [Lingula anatina]